jgi:aspartate carbamoyltransferase catalytic subunit
MTKTAQLSTRHLLGIKDLSTEDIQLILETADNFKDVLNRPIKKVPSLRDITIANIFFENSTRTRLSFELAEKRLSADTINFAASSSSVSKGETLIDTVNNILAMKVDMIVMRHPYAGAGVFLSILPKLCLTLFRSGSNLGMLRAKKWPLLGISYTLVWLCPISCVCKNWVLK